MPITPTQRPTREWPLLILAVALVCAVCIPLWQYFGQESQPAAVRRAARLLFGPEQIACYACAAWGGFVLLSRYWEVRRQRQAFGLDLLPTDEGARILPEDARPLQRKIDQVSQARGPFILTNMLRLALGKYAISRSSQDVSETVRIQAEVDQSRLVTTMATVHYLAWAIPALGFLGTVRGLAMSLGMGDKVDIGLVTQHLNHAFDCTLVALTLSLPLMFLIHSVQRDEEAVVIDSQQYCLEHLVNRLYEAEPAPPAGAEPPPRAAVRARIPR